MRGKSFVALTLALFVASACGTGIGATFEPGVEHVPGPGSFVVKVVPGDAVDDRRIRFSAYGDHTVLFVAHRGDDRYLLGGDLPSTLRAHVDGADCSGSVDLVSDMESDATLTIDGQRCDLRLDLSHRAGTVDHMLEDDGPMAS
ncbi:MAG TPA: hypothetical protein VFM38_03840 [Candidatus Limnocylindrales bacterium]|nr:hypothetical protein [Candidatus Limnocylindrales bacterium]